MARGFCILFITSVLLGGALVRGGIIAGIYSLRRLLIKRYGQLDERPFVTLDCCPMSWYFMKRFQ